MQLIDPATLKIEMDKVEEINRLLQSIYRMLLFSPLYSDDDLLTKYLNSTHRYHDLVAFKNAQMEAQNAEELELYLVGLTKAFHFIVEEIVAQRTFNSPIDLFHLLRIIAPATHKRHPNKYRQTLVQVGSHICPEPVLVPHCIETLFSNLALIKEPVIAAIYLHHELVRIHPFSDGNGRVSRMAKNWLLMYNLYPPIVIATESARKEYVLTLSKSFSDLSRSPDVFGDATRAFFFQEIDRLRSTVMEIHAEVSLLVCPDSAAPAL